MGVRKVGAEERRKAEMPRSDVRAARTRRAVIDAFVALFFTRPYGQITVADIARRAKVGRSTLYEHFVDKEDVLAASVRMPLTDLARAVEPGSSVASLRRALDHFRENRDQARSLFAGSARRAITRVLASMIEERLKARGGERGEWSDAERAVAAVALAEMQIGTIVTWLRGEVRAGVGEVAEVLQGLARGNPNVGTGAR